MPYLHVFLFIHQKKADDFLEFSFQRIQLFIPSAAVLLRGFAGRVGSDRVLSFTDPAVSPLLTVQTQVDFTSLTADHCSQPPPVRYPTVTFTWIAVGYVARCDSDPVVVPHALLAVELQLAAHALQAAAFIALEGGLVSATAGVALLTNQDTVQPLLRWRALTAHYTPKYNSEVAHRTETTESKVLNALCKYTDWLSLRKLNQLTYSRDPT